MKDELYKIKNKIYLVRRILEAKIILFIKVSKCRIEINVELQIEMLPAIIIVILLKCAETTAANNKKVLRHYTIYGKSGTITRFSYISMKILENKILQIQPMSGSYTRSGNECQRKCALTTGCIALNVIPENSTYFHCHLLDKDHYLRQPLLMEAIGSQYHVVSVCCSFCNYS